MIRNEAKYPVDLARDSIIDCTIPLRSMHVTLLCADALLTAEPGSMSLKDFLHLYNKKYTKGKNIPVNPRT